MPYAINVEEVEKFITESGLSASTVRSYRYYLRGLIAWMSESEAENEFEMEHVRRFIESHEWAPSTKNLAYAACLTFLRWKYGDEGVQLRRWKRRASPTRLVRYLTLEELRQVLAWLRDEGTESTTRDEAMIALMADTGLRVSEICNLRIANVDFQKRKLVVQVKGGQSETAVYSENTASRMERWLEVRARLLRRGERLAQKKGIPFKPPAEVFISVAGTTPYQRMNRHGVKSNFTVIGERSGIGKLAPHDLRRTFAMSALRNGAPTYVVQIAGRWKSRDMVERYLRFIAAEDLAAYFPMRDIT